MGCVQSANSIKIEKKNINDNNENENFENLSNLNIENKTKKNNKTNYSTNQFSSTANQFDNTNNTSNNKNDTIKDIFNFNIPEINNNFNIINKISKNDTFIEYKLQSKIDPNLFKSLKIINKKNLGESSSDEKIMEEIKVLTSLSNERLLQVENCFFDANNYYIITEYCKLGNLTNLQKKVISFSENQTKFIIFQLLNAVSYLYSRNFVHTDIKPNYILIDKTFKFKGEDYYYIKLLDFTSSNSKNQKSKKLVNNLPFYTSPEVLDMNFNYKCDIWSIGIIFYEMIHGYLPFKAKNYDEVSFSIKNINPVYDDNIISQNGLNLLKKMLIKNPNDRLNVNECLNHVWFSNVNEIKSENNTKIELTQIKEETYIINNNINNTTTNKIVPEKQIKVLFKNIMNEIKLLNRGHSRRNSISVNRFSNKKTNLKNELINEIIKYIHHYIRRNFELNQEKKYLQNLFNKYKVNDEISIESIIICFKKYTGFENHLVNDLACDEIIYEKLKKEMNKSKLNLVQFQNFLIKEKSLVIEDKLWKVFSNFHNNRNELLNCCNYVQPTSKFKKYFLEIKKEIYEQKLKENYLFFEFKSLIEQVIENIKRKEK